jgi:hypothetical protein
MRTFWAIVIGLGLSLFPASFAADLAPTAAEQSNVGIRSAVGGTVKLLSPWGHRGFTVVEQDGNANAPVATEGQVFSFPTTAGKIYLLSMVK